MTNSIKRAIKVSTTLVCFLQVPTLAEDYSVQSELTQNKQNVEEVEGTQNLQDSFEQELWSVTGLSPRRRLANEEAEPCIVDSDCDYYPYTLCDNELRECYHKPMFPTTGLEIAGVIVFSLIKAASNVAGIGGGGITIPIVMQFFYFTTKPAIAISSFAILVGSFARFVVNWREKHPEKPNVVSIDYGMTMVMMPTTLAGAQIGSFILITFPSLAIQIMLTVMLIFLTIKSGTKGAQIYRKETIQLKEKRLNAVKPDDKSDKGNIEMSAKEGQTALENPESDAVNSKDDSEKEGKLKDKDGSGDVTKAANDSIQASSAKGNVIEIDGKTFNLGESEEKDKELKKLAKLVKQEAGHGQWVKQLLNVSLLFCLILLNLFRGNTSMDSIIGIPKCSAEEYVVMIIFVLICVGFTVLAVHINNKEQLLKEKYNINFVESDIRLRGRNLAKVLLIGFFGGWVAGALGLGGGAIFNPALLALGVPPVVSSATGMYLVSFSKIASCFVYALNGQLVIDYCLWIGLWSVVSSVLSLYAADFYMRKFGRQSIIVWILTFILGISAIAVPIFGGLSLKAEAEKGIDIYAFNSLCE